MTVDRKALQAGWNQTRDHLDAARGHLTDLQGADLSAALEFLEHHELGLAFDSLVDQGADLDLPLAFRRRRSAAAYGTSSGSASPTADAGIPVRLPCAGP
ncbi:MafI family immunity protein [Streptomyces sp. NPDC003863]